MGKEAIDGLENKDGPYQVTSADVDARIIPFGKIDEKFGSLEKLCKDMELYEDEVQALKKAKIYQKENWEDVSSATWAMSNLSYFATYIGGYEEKSYVGVVEKNQKKFFKNVESSLRGLALVGYKTSGENIEVAQVSLSTVAEKMMNEVARVQEFITEIGNRELDINAETVKEIKEDLDIAKKAMDELEGIAENFTSILDSAKEVGILEPVKEKEYDSQLASFEAGLIQANQNHTILNNILIKEDKTSKIAVATNNFKRNALDHFKTHLTNYWNVRDKSYKFKFFDTDKVKRKTYIDELKELLEGYKRGNTEEKDKKVELSEIQEKLVEGKKAFSTGYFSNTSHWSHNLSGIINEISDTIDVLNDKNVNKQIDRRLVGTDKRMERAEKNIKV